MKNEETGQPQFRADRQFFIHHFPVVAAGKRELRGEEQPALELPGIGAGGGCQTERAKVFADGHPAV